MSHISHSVHLHCCVHTALSLFPTSSPSSFFFFSPTSVSHCLFLSSSLSISPFLFLWFNNWCETFCLSSASWGGLRDMTWLWALSTTTDTHTDTHDLLQSSNGGHLCCINVERKVFGVYVFSIYCACNTLLHVSLAKFSLQWVASSLSTGKETNLLPYLLYMLFSL